MSMRILSLNVNGLRAFYNRGKGDGWLLQDLIDENDPDVILFQETKCSPEDVAYWLQEWQDNWNIYAVSNEYIKGYAGVAAMIRKDSGLVPGLKEEFLSYKLIESEYDTGRIVVLSNEEIAIVGVYVLNSGEKEELRIKWDKKFKSFLQKIQSNRKLIILGDLNATTDEYDCYAFTQYFDNCPGVMSFEIDALKSLMKDLQLTDSFRYMNKAEDYKYSWFSYRGNSRWNNQGFRLDYALVDDRLRSNIKVSDILGSPCQFSDHSPILLELEI